MSEIDDKKKQVIGLYGEMQLSMRLHELGWQVHRAYIDEGIDFVATKYYCPKCKRYSNQYIKYTEYNGNKRKCVTNLCEHCKGSELKIISRYLQVKTSEGENSRNVQGVEVKDFSFHPKIRYDMGKEVFYIWIAVFDKPNFDKRCHFYIFNTKNVSKFDNLELATYQITDNQKTTLRINENGVVLNKSKLYDFSCFNNRFYEDWDSLELETKE